MMAFIFMHRRTIKDHCGGISLNIILKKEKSKLLIGRHILALSLKINNIHGCVCLLQNRGCDGWYSPKCQTSSAQLAGLKLFAVPAVKLDTGGTTASKSQMFVRLISSNDNSYPMFKSELPRMSVVVITSVVWFLTSAIYKLQFSQSGNRLKLILSPIFSLLVFNVFTTVDKA